MARNPKSKNILGGGGRGSRPQLEGEALERYNELKSELKYYEDIKRKVWGRRKKIKQILDNFDRVITEDIVSNESPGLTEGEIDNIIDNSVIISQTDILNKINESSYNTATINELKIVLNELFKLEVIENLINTSDELGNNEMYSRLLYQWVWKATSNSGIKDAFRDIIESIEDDLL